MITGDDLHGCIAIGLITGNDMGICSNRALPTAGVIKDDEKHDLLLYNTGPYQQE